MQQVIHRVDPEAHRRAAEFGPCAAPRGGVVGGVAKPKGVAHGDERPTELPRAREIAQMRGRGSEAHLENARGVVTGALLRRRDRVGLGERTAEGLLAPHPRASVHRRNTHGDVLARWRGDDHEVGFRRAQHRPVIGERFRDLVARGEIADPSRVEIRRGDQFHATLRGLNGADVRIADAAGAGEHGAISFEGLGHGRRAERLEK